MGLGEEAQREAATCLRSHSKTGLLVPHSLPLLPLSAFRVFLSEHQEVGKGGRAAAQGPQLHFELLIMSIGFSLRKERGREKGIGPQWRTETGKRKKEWGGEKLRATLK